MRCGKYADRNAGGPRYSLQESTGKHAYELLKLYAKPHGLHVFDSLVAATAMEEGLTLVTKNRRHFGIIQGLRLEVPGY